MLMKSIFAETIDKVVEEVLQYGESIIKVDGAEQPTQIAGCWETDSSGKEVIGIYLYVNGQQIYKIQDIGTKILFSVH